MPADTTGYLQVRLNATVLDGVRARANADTSLNQVVNSMLATQLGLDPAAFPVTRRKPGRRSNAEKEAGKISRKKPRNQA